MFFRNNNNFIKKYFIKELFFILIIYLIFNFSTIVSLHTLDRDEARYVQDSIQIIDTKNQILFGILQNNEPVLLMSKLILLKAIQLMIF